MQIKAISVNSPAIAATRSIQGTGKQARPGNNIFGAQCRVTISQEGRRLSRQQEAQTKQSSQSVKTDRMRRQQEEAERNRNIKKGYIDDLKSIEEKIKSLNGSFTPMETLDTIEEEQKTLQAMRSQKQAQIEENQRRAKEAQQMAMQFSKYQKNIDDGNRDLLTLLKTIENEKEAQDDENGAIEGGSENGIKNKTGGAIQNSASQLTASSIKRELGVTEMLSGLSDEGHYRLDLAETITRNILTEAENIRTSLDEERFTDEEKAKMVAKFKEGMPFNYKDVEYARREGLQLLRSARDCRIRHIADNPMADIEGTKDSMMLSAADAAFGEAAHGKLGETSQELKAEVEKLIDRRNSVDRPRQDKEEDEDSSTANCV